MLSVGSSCRQSRIHNADHIMHPSRNREGEEISKLAHYDDTGLIFAIHGSWIIQRGIRLKESKRGKGGRDTTREEMNGEGAIFVVFGKDEVKIGIISCHDRYSTRQISEYRRLHGIRWRSFNPFVVKIISCVIFDQTFSQSAIVRYDWSHVREKSITRSNFENEYFNPRTRKFCIPLREERFVGAITRG